MASSLKPQAANLAFGAVEEYLLALYAAWRVLAGNIASHSIDGCIIRALLLVYGLVCIVRIAVAGGISWPRSRLLLALFLYAVVLTTTAAVGLHRAGGFERAGLILELMALLCLLALSPDDGRKARLLAVLVGAGAASIVYGCFQKLYSLAAAARYAEDYGLGVAALPWGRERLFKGEPFAQFVTSNVFAGYLLLVMPLLLAAGCGALRAGRDRVKACVALAAGAAGVCLILASGSKGAWIALLVCALLAVWMCRGGRMNAAMFWGLVCAAVASAGLLAAASGPASSMGIRGGYWLGGLKALLAKPLGIGAGGFEVAYPRYQPIWAMQSRSIHSAYLGALVEGGPMLLLVFLYLLHSLFKAGGSLPLARLQPSAFGLQSVDSGSPAEPSNRLAGLTSALGLLGGWLLAACLSDAQGGEHVFRLLAAPSLGEALKAAAVLAGPICAVLVYSLLARPASPHAGLAAPLLAHLPEPSASSLQPPVSSLHSSFLVALVAFSVHAAVEFVWEEQATVLSLLLMACCFDAALSLERSGLSTRPQASSLKPQVSRRPSSFVLHPSIPVRLAGASAAALVIAVCAVLLVVVPLAGVRALGRARAAGEVHHDCSRALAALQRVAATPAGQPAEAGDMRMLMNIFPPEEHAGVRRALDAEGGRERLEHSLRQCQSAAASDIAGSALEALARLRDDRIAEEAALLLLDAGNCGGPDSTRLLAEAERFWRQAIEVVPEHARYWALGGQIAAASGWHEQALACFYAATRFQPASPLRWLAAGDAAVLSAEPATAARCYQRAMSLNCETVEEKCSLYTLVYFPALLTWPPAGRFSEFHVALSALVRAMEETGGTAGAGPVLFRAALEDIRLGLDASARQTFAALAEFYGGPEETSMNVFRWALDVKAGAADAAQASAQLAASVPYPAVLERIERRIQEAARQRQAAGVLGR